MTLLDALYINNSGGKVLLDLLIKALSESGADVFYLLDDRCLGDYNELPANRVLYLKANIKNRKNFYEKKSKDFTKVICFGNIPPTQRLRATVYTYFHNINLLVQPRSLSFRSRLMHKLKRTYISFLKKNNDIWLVQSENMNNVLCEVFNLNKNIVKNYPFYRHTERIDTPRDPNSFFYISNGNEHKNHDTLLDAWELLFKEKIDASLVLTVTSSYPHLQYRIAEMQKLGVNVVNKGWVNPLDLYRKGQFLIYPSLAESFGLGLVEATEAGCEVIGADLPYTHAVVNPLATFNPLNARNIAEVVKKVINKPQKEQVTKINVPNRLDDLLELLK